MTATVSSSGRAGGRGVRVRGRAAGAGRVGRVRSVTFGLHVVVVLLAVMSLGTNRFDLWVDMRRLGVVGGELLKILWVGTVLVVPLAAGPGLGWWGGRWRQRGMAPGLVGALLWPTYGVMGCLVVNSAWYYALLRQDAIDTMVPVPVTGVVLVVLGAWVVWVREWVRVSRGLGERAPAGVGVRVGMGALGAVAAGVGGFVIFLYGYHRAMPASWGGEADVAIVLGNRVRDDGSASLTLAGRARVAADLYRRGVVKHLFLSGMISKPAGEGLPERNEARAMEGVCLAEGVPEEAMTLDPVGVNTRATAFNAKRFMDAHGYKRAVVCTSDYHLFRSVMACRESGIDAAAAGCVGEVDDMGRGWRCAELMETVHEMAGVVVYAVDADYRLPKAYEMQLKMPRVVVKKSANELELYDGGTLVKRYGCITGSNAGDKEKEGDRKTPEGVFHIVYKNAESKFHLSLGLDYPTAADAERGLKEGVITQQQRDDIVAALGSDLSKAENQKKLWYTPLGGEIFLHGHGEGRTGTAGCVALSNGDIEELWAVLPVGTEVRIEP